ncbi:unnamed protein product [Amoebophrya sp. A120]|nr:unnamed protein product [Amoebophrya sp. A120]|eukprot:GSA120T00013612001.1
MPTKTAVDYLSADLDVVGGEVEKDHPMNLSNIAADDAKSLLLAYKRDQIDFYVSHHRDSRMDRDSTVAAEQVVDEETKKSQNRINDLFSMFLKKETRIMGLHSWKAEVCVRVLVANKGELVLDYPGRRVDHRKNENRKVLCEQKISEPGWWEVWLRQKRLQNKETFKEVV